MVKKKTEKEIAPNMVKEHEINLSEGSWESLAIKAKALKDRGASRSDVSEASYAATKAFNELVNEERGTVGKIYGGFRLDGSRLIAWVNGVEHRMDSFLFAHWYIEKED